MYFYIPFLQLVKLCSLKDKVHCLPFYETLWCTVHWMVELDPCKIILSPLTLQAVLIIPGGESFD